MRFLLLLVLLACASASAAAPVVPDYSAEIALVRPHLTKERLILLGEMHGTREIPQLVGQLIEDLSAEQPLVLALEVNASEQAAFDHYLASDGGAQARAQLEHSPFWSPKSNQHDGRRNHQALALIERVRALRASGRTLSLLAFDPAASTRDHHERDRVMATSLRKVIADNPDTRVLVLTGNVHAMRSRPSYAPPQMQTPMGSYLGDLDPYSINISAREGASWACQRAICAPIKSAPRQPESGPQTDGPYDYQLVLARFTVADLLGE